jgi:hypothetical protein
MDARSTFNLLISGGFALSIEGDRLRVTPPERLTEKLRELIRTNRQGLMALLSASSQTAHVARPEDDPQPDAQLDHFTATDRRFCTDCTELRGARCIAAARGELPHAARRYEPMQDRLHRCIAYQPGPADPDRRPGRELWPGMARKAAKQMGRAA